MSIKLTDNVDANGLGINADHEALAALNQDYEKSGFATMAAESNAEGDGVGRVVRPAEISEDFRLRVGVDNILFQDNFSHGVVNTSKYKVVNTTATNALSGGRWVLNNGNSVTSGQGTQISTYAQFRLNLSYVTYIDVVAQFAQLPQANNVCEIGLGFVTGVAAPTDGVLFRLNAAGVLQGVVNYGGSETSVALDAFTVEPSKMYHFLAVLHNDTTSFWIDDVLYGQIVTPTTAGSPLQSMSAPFFARIYNSGAVTTAQRLEISNVSISAGDQNMTRPAAQQQSVQGLNGINAPDGATAGYTANFASSAAPASATLSNTAAGYATLGGQWQFAAVAGAETDYILFAYLNPAGSSTAPGKNMVVTGMAIDSINTVVAVATTPTVLQWGVGVGQTAVTMATADSATAGTRTARRLTVGMQTFVVGAAAGAIAQRIDTQFSSPLVVEPGTYFHVLLKVPVGTATATEIFRGTCTINAFFE